MAKLSIIIPVHNTCEYLEQCIGSVLNQTFSDFELILVDDGSTDGSERFVEQFAERDIRIRTLHQSQSGVSVARNKGIEIALGEYLVFLDSDDYFSNPDALSLLAQHSILCHADVIFYGYTDEDMITGKCRSSQRGFDARAFHKEKTELLNYIYDAGLFPTACWQMAVRREFVLSNQIRFPEHIVCEDIDWGITILYKADTYTFVDESLMTYRRNRNGSLMHRRGLKHLQGCMYAVRRWLDVPKEERYLGLTNFVAHMYGYIFSYYTVIPRSERLKVEAEFKRLDYVLTESNKWNHHLIYYAERLLGITFTSWMIRIIYKLFYAPGSLLGYLRKKLQ